MWEIQDQLRAAGHEVKDQEVAWSVLAGLPSTFDMVATVLETTNEEMSLDTIMPKLQQVEQRMRQTQTVSTDEAALMAKRKSRFYDNQGRFNRLKERRCYVCGQPGHIAKDCRENGNGHHRNGAVYNVSAVAL